MRATVFLVLAFLFPLNLLAEDCKPIKGSDLSNVERALAFETFVWMISQFPENEVFVIALDFGQPRKVSGSLLSRVKKNTSSPSTIKVLTREPMAAADKAKAVRVAITHMCRYSGVKAMTDVTMKKGSEALVREKLYWITEDGGRSWRQII